MASDGVRCDANKSLSQARAVRVFPKSRINFTRSSCDISIQKCFREVKKGRNAILVESYITVLKQMLIKIASYTALFLVFLNYR